MFSLFTDGVVCLSTFLCFWCIGFSHRVFAFLIILVVFTLE